MTSKLAAEKNQRALLELASQPGNDICADCKARAPRWASHNLGIFICVNCASIHRKIGTHITKVKSLTLDTWTKDQVENMKTIGNTASNAKYNPDETRYPPPANLIDSERDSELEKFIRAKYEFKSFIKRGTTSTASSTTSDHRSRPSALTPSSSLDRSAAVAALLGPSRSAASRSATLSSSLSNAPTATSTPSAPYSASSLPLRSTPSVSGTLNNAPVSAPLAPARSVSQPYPTAALSSAPVSQTTFNSSTFAGVHSLQPKTIDATLPLQVAATPTSAPLPVSISSSTSYLSAPNPFHNLSATNTSAASAPPYLSSFNQTTGISPGSTGSGLSPGMNPGYGTNYTGTNISPFQPSPINPTGNTFTPMTNTPSPNPFAVQSPQGAGAPGSYGVQYSQPQTPFGGPMFTGQQFGQQQLQPFAPQPQMQFSQPQAQMQVPMSGNPFMPNQSTPSPFMGAHAGSTPSPFGGAQPMQQVNMMQQPQQQQQTGFVNTNPFTSWVQRPPGQQQGYSQQW
ncbi:hypothetical protein PHLGIDRAFT_130169 [Phlebiopsis gigantea 11061_1 CR5-6]|uniref:Arf-GAP domain-containing protein n=1 Tax=Phlebiopsis gigantea (strain 11061_1 CR5-6) TaxID=745531 RepID=A0A0C3NFD4_PHLG1|nr:hypothetical protein PHLGIDRAFT_130169 [Phlebiopsis gigantea 11061_1 CR5-6]